MHTHTHTHCERIEIGTQFAFSQVTAHGSKHSQAHCKEIVPFVQSLMVHGAQLSNRNRRQN